MAPRDIPRKCRGLAAGFGAFHLDQVQRWRVTLRSVRNETVTIRMPLVLFSYWCEKNVTWHQIWNHFICLSASHLSFHFLLWKLNEVLTSPGGRNTVTEGLFEDETKSRHHGRWLLVPARSFTDVMFCFLFRNLFTDFHSKSYCTV